MSAETDAGTETPAATPATPATTPHPAPAEGAGTPAQGTGTSSPTSLGDQQTGTATSASAAPWREGLEGELLEFASRFAGPKDLVEAAYNLRKANGSMVRVPAADAKPEDIAKFRAAIGVPASPEKYEFDLGREMTEADKRITASIAKAAHHHGVQASAMRAMSKEIAQLAVSEMEEENRVALKNRADSAAELAREWGADREKNLLVGKQAVVAFGGEKLQKVLDGAMYEGTKLGDHPDVVRAWAKVGLRLAESDYIGQHDPQARTSMEDRVRRILAENPIGTERYKDPAVQRELTDLYRRLHGTGDIVGVGGRVT